MGSGIRKASGALLCLLALCLAEGAAAGQLKVSPVRLDLSAAQPLGVLKVGNTGQEESLIHIRVRAWNHRTGRDAFDESRDVLVNPMIFKLGPGEDQLIRVGLRRPSAGDSEIAYRVFIQEVPEGKPKLKQRVTTYLRISLPLFVAPREPDAPILVWSVEPRSPEEMLLKVENQGNLHSQISSFALLRQTGEALTEVEGRTYVLPGQGREWIVPRKAMGDNEILTLASKDLTEGAKRTALRLSGPASVEQVQQPKE